jgi:hypothetical protein
MTCSEREVITLKGMLTNAHPVRSQPTQTNRMKVTIQDNKLIIELPLETPSLSGSGKNLVVASTHGIITTSALVNGKAVKIGVNAFIPAK